MMRHRVSYAHLGAKVNPKHVASLVDYFESGCKPDSEFRYGVEIEHLPVRRGDDKAAGYYGRDGVENLLKDLRPYYRHEEEYWENGHLLGLGRPLMKVSLEPGSQVESSIGPCGTLGELVDLYQSFRQELDPIASRMGFRLVNYGYQPRSGYADIRVVPKDRYAAMTDYLGRVGQYGLCMMRCSASTQVSIDYRDEADAVAKLRVGTALGPVISWFFKNSPWFEGGPNPYPLLRQRIWDFTDFQRTNLSPGLFDPDFGWEDYAVDVLSTPLMYVDLTHTPEAAGLEQEGLRRVAFKDNAADVYPDRRLNDYEVGHILSTHFNDVRLKKIVELRHWDSLPIARAIRLTGVVGNTFYDQAQFERLTAFCSQLEEADVFAAKADLQARGSQARPYGKSLDEWGNLLGVEDSLDNLPGDPVHPDVFQV